MSNAEDISIDANGDGVPDLIVNHFDTNDDGRIDETVAVFDSDDDGAVDTRREEHLVDIDGDGDIDRVSFVDTLGNSQTEVIVDLNADDTDDVIDGQAASTDGQTFLDTPAGQAFVNDPFGDTTAALDGANGAGVTNGGATDPPPFTPAPPPADGTIIPTPHDDPAPDEPEPPVVVTVPETGPFHDPPPDTSGAEPRVPDDDPSFGTGAADDPDAADTVHDGTTAPTGAEHAGATTTVIADPEVHSGGEAATATSVAASIADIDDPTSLIDDIRDGFGSVVGDLVEDIAHIVE